ncbi:MAG: nickel pincer cofactor biosynthesis protein LarB [Planctomycetaceae bacterium]
MSDGVAPVIIEGMNHDLLVRLVEDLRSGELDVAAAMERLLPHVTPPTVRTPDAAIDLDRHRRCGFPEVVYCEGKTAEAIVEIFAIQCEHGETPFGTRISPEQAEVVLKRFPQAIHNRLARTIRLPEDRPLIGRVPVVTAGTSDRPVAEEAVETLRWMGVGTELIVDVGVAGPQRLQEVRPRFAGADAVVVVAGMEGALPSVVGGFVDCPVIAVPTSVGYGASFGGLGALLGMLTSCAANVTAVNIDAGFKGGYVAGLIASRQ